MIDNLGALRLRIDRREAAADGPLAGLDFVVKDMFDVAGITTGGGNPDWLATHEPATTTAPAVTACLAAGGRLVGIAIADELAFSPFGENPHYGTPRNPAAPGRVPGGSSSGSASATAGGLADFALGTDTAGSVRIPASFCGVFGLRPTHGRIPAEGVMPLSPSFDVVGWFARDAEMLARVGQILLRPRREAGPPRRLLLLEDAFMLADPEARPALEAAVRQVSKALGPVRRVRLSDHGFDAWLAHYNTLRPPEVWASLGAWIARTRPRFGPLTAGRFAAVERAKDADTGPSQAFRSAVQAKAADLLGEDGVFLLPTVPGIAPETGLDEAIAAGLREAIFRLSTIAPMLGMPEVTLPLARAAGCPVGLSLLGPKNGDEMLLAAAVAVTGDVT